MKNNLLAWIATAFLLGCGGPSANTDKSANPDESVKMFKGSSPKQNSSDPNDSGDPKTAKNSGDFNAGS